ncbi:MAG: hypothetical protein WA144_04375 [Candidatus Methanoperedens sp.]
MKSETIKGLKLNKNRLLLIGFVILFNIYYASAAIEQACFDNYFLNMEPSLSLAVRNNNPIINKGEPINLEIYISGYGHIANITKIYVTLPIGLVDENTAFGNGYYSVYNNTYKNWSKEPFLMDNSYSTGFYIWLDQFHFQQAYSEENCSQVMLFSERNEFSSGEKIAPSGINFITSKNAPEGDNKINLVLTYSDGKKWYQDKQDVSYHINSWQEEHNILFAIFIALCGAAAVAASSFIWHKIAIKVNASQKRTTTEKRGTQGKRN